jgi:glyoxylase-like metal-dependent hydrolase (beta-lactamase superfamily II)
MNRHKKFLALFVILLCSALQIVPAAGAGRSKEVVPGIYVISDLSFATCGFIVTDDGVVVVDTQLIPLFANEMIKEIKSVTDKPIRYAVNTHWHTDHVGGNEVFQTLGPVIAHEFTQKVIARRRREQLEGKADESLKQLGKLVLTPPDITFTENLTLHLGNRTIELMFLDGGHTSGDIVVYLPNEKVLFTGDLFIKGSGLPDYRDDSSIDKMIASLKKMHAMDVEKIICGHMGIAAKDDIQASIDKLLAFRKKVKTFVDGNIPPEKAAEQIAFPAGENPFYQQHFKKIIHKLYSDLKNAPR